MLEGYPKERGFQDLTQREREYLLSIPNPCTFSWVNTIRKAMKKEPLDDKKKQEWMNYCEQFQKDRL